MNEVKYDVVIIMVDRADDESDAEIWKITKQKSINYYYYFKIEFSSFAMIIGQRLMTFN